jgi:predicted nucleotidyltransferase
MDNERILSLLVSRRKEILGRFGVKKLDLIGSATGDSRRSGSGSDVGILIEFKNAATFDKYMALKSYLNDCSRRPSIAG